MLSSNLVSTCGSKGSDRSRIFRLRVPANSEQLSSCCDNVIYYGCVVQYIDNNVLDDFFCGLERTVTGTNLVVIDLVLFS